jgi:Golgi nucleoside diphosphatase
MAENNITVEVEDGNMETSFQQTFGWFVVINRLSSNDITKHEMIYGMNVVEVLNHLTYLISYDREQERLLKQSTKNY